MTSLITTDVQKGENNGVVLTLEIVTAAVRILPTSGAADVFDSTYRHRIRNYAYHIAAIAQRQNPCDVFQGPSVSDHL